MKKNTILKTIIIFITLVITYSIFAFDWPQEIINNNSISSYFGQKRGSQLSKSIIFTDPEEITAIDDGKVLAVIMDEFDYTDFFPSTLGSAVIIEHDDSLISVYGNLDTDSLNENLANKMEVSKGDILSQAGNTGWQENRSSLEFQVVDKKTNSAVNPKLFMPRSDNESRIYIDNICLINKTGDYFYLDLHKTLNSGIYKVYMKRNTVAAPYKTTININGITADQVSFDHINVENGKLYVNGKKKYTYLDIFPNNELTLLGEITLTPGKSEVSVFIEDFNGKVTQDNFTLTILN